MHSITVPVIYCCCKTHHLKINGMKNSHLIFRFVGQEFRQGEIRMAVSTIQNLDHQLALH